MADPHNRGLTTRPLKVTLEVPLQDANKERFLMVVPVTAHSTFEDVALEAHARYIANYAGAMESGHVFHKMTAFGGWDLDLVDHVYDIFTLEDSNAEIVIHYTKEDTLPPMPTTSRLRSDGMTSASVVQDGHQADAIERARKRQRTGYRSARDIPTGPADKAQIRIDASVAEEATVACGDLDIAVTSSQTAGAQREVYPIIRNGRPSARGAEKPPAVPSLRPSRRITHHKKCGSADLLQSPPNIPQSENKDQSTVSLSCRVKTKDSTAESSSPPQCEGKPGQAWSLNENQILSNAFRANISAREIYDRDLLTGRSYENIRKRLRRLVRGNLDSPPHHDDGGDARRSRDDADGEDAVGDDESGGHDGADKDNDEYDDADNDRDLVVNTLRFSREKERWTKDEDDQLSKVSAYGLDGSILRDLAGHFGRSSKAIQHRCARLRSKHSIQYDSKRTPTEDILSNILGTSPSRSAIARSSSPLNRQHDSDSQYTMQRATKPASNLDSRRIAHNMASGNHASIDHVQERQPSDLTPAPEIWGEVDMANLRHAVKLNMGWKRAKDRYFQRYSSQDVATRYGTVQRALESVALERKTEDYKVARIQREVSIGRISLGKNAPWPMSDKCLLLTARLEGIEMRKFARRRFPRRDAAQVLDIANRLYGSVRKTAQQANPGHPVSVETIRRHLPEQMRYWVDKHLPIVHHDREEFRRERRTEQEQREERARTRQQQQLHRQDQKDRMQSALRIARNADRPRGKGYIAPITLSDGRAGDPPIDHASDEEHVDSMPASVVMDEAISQDGGDAATEDDSNEEMARAGQSEHDISNRSDQAGYAVDGKSGAEIPNTKDVLAKRTTPPFVAMPQEAWVTIEKSPTGELESFDRACSVDGVPSSSTPERKLQTTIPFGDLDRAGNDIDSHNSPNISAGPGVTNPRAELSRASETANKSARDTAAHEDILKDSSETSQHDGQPTLSEILRAQSSRERDEAAERRRHHDARSSAILQETYDREIRRAREEAIAKRDRAIGVPNGEIIDAEESADEEIERFPNGVVDSRLPSATSPKPLLGFPRQPTGIAASTLGSARPDFPSSGKVKSNTPSQNVPRSPDHDVHAFTDPRVEDVTDVLDTQEVAMDKLMAADGILPLEAQEPADSPSQADVPQKQTAKRRRRRRNRETKRKDSRAASADREAARSPTGLRTNHDYESERKSSGDSKAKVSRTAAARGQTTSLQQDLNRDTADTHTTRVDQVADQRKHKIVKTVMGHGLTADDMPEWNACRTKIEARLNGTSDPKTGLRRGKKHNIPGLEELTWMEFEKCRYEAKRKAEEETEKRKQAHEKRKSARRVGILLSPRTSDSDLSDVLDDSSEDSDGGADV